MERETNKVSVAVCEPEPLVTEGLRTVLAANKDFELQNASRTMETAGALLRTHPSDVLLLAKSFGTAQTLTFLKHNQTSGGPRIVVWGPSINDTEAVRFIQAGARGVISRTAEIGTLLACLQTVAAGGTWMENTFFRDRAAGQPTQANALTAREQQVRELVEQGMRNKEIAERLGISTGTVKIHLRHVFEKTGTRNRYSLAVNGSALAVCAL